ncbi:MAG TPA: diguanylate cyclase [Thermoanaerobaculia bacterium]|jgi:diguanylate cyclase (GGDEF)-like protein
MRALVADSDPDRLRQLETWLIQWGYEVWPARNGVEAWNRLSSEKTPIVAILSWQMDAMHGIDVCRRIRLQPELPTAYVLLIAENRGSESLLEGLNAGADDFLFAPLDAVEARARIRNGARIVEVEEALRASQQALRVQSTRDGVTGVWNHAAILDMLSKERERARRKSGSVAIVLADLDETRKVNENLGHPIGDEVLREAARRMNSSVRPYDAVGRYGGDEFLIVLPGSDGLGALTVAERIRESFSKRPIHTSAGPVPMTLSLGVASEGGEAITDSAALLQAADSALKRAQQNGRNRAALADESGMAIDIGPAE